METLETRDNGVVILSVSGRVDAANAGSFEQRLLGFEVTVPKPFLSAGAFDAQGLVTVARARLIRKLGDLQPDEMALVEEAVKRYLGL